MTLYFYDASGCQTGLYLLEDWGRSKFDLGADPNYFIPSKCYSQIFIEKYFPFCLP